ncbi:MAG TPA: ABC transporter substrate-binding protein [Candidatus Krumholzibacteria bacterium]
MRRRVRTIAPHLPVIAAIVLLAASACTRKQAATPGGVLVVSQEQQASWIRNFNPLTTATAARWPSLAGVYEPLFVFNSIRAEYVPWLGVDHEWLSGNRVLRVTTREGVRWSDGTPFTARDVAFTFQLMKKFPALDRRGCWGFLSGVRATGDRTVEFEFKRVFIPGFDEVAAQQIVPEHAWKDVADPVTYANETPVATGPFTEVRVFRNQVYELGRNPYYWQEGRPRFEAIRCLAYPSNDRANMALVFDELDWAGNFIPAVDRVFVARKEGHHYWFPLTGSSIFLYANTQRAPFGDLRVRKALSMAIDRDLLVDVALYRYSRPADATGLSDAYSAWHNQAIGESAPWMHHDLARANALLDEAGLARGADGIRRRPDGRALKYDIVTVSGWSDWVRASQVIARNLREAGIDASVRTYDFAAWFQRVQEGDFDLCLGWSFEGPTPYLFYRWLMSSATVAPAGTASMGNWHRYGSARADSVLAAFEREPDPTAMKQLSDALQQTFVDEFPAVPLYPNPSWAEYNTARFSGFPSRENPYCDPSPNKFDRGECLIVLTTIEPDTAVK